MGKKIKVSAVIVSGGYGTRMGIKENKAFVKIADVPVVAMSAGAFQRSPLVDEIVIVLPADLIRRGQDMTDEFKLNKVTKIVSGGATRQESVLNGLNAVSADCDIVAIHDGARPLVTQDIIASAIDGAVTFGAAIVCVPVKDTIKSVDKDNNIVSTCDRAMLKMAQTPQVFKYPLIMPAYQKIHQSDLLFTDDASVAEHFQIPVKTVMGSYENIKITTAEDLKIAKEIVLSRK